LIVFFPLDDKAQRQAPIPLLAGRHWLRRTPLDVLWAWACRRQPSRSNPHLLILNF